jgi:hypothetical protein
LVNSENPFANFGLSEKNVLRDRRLNRIETHGTFTASGDWASIRAS